MAGKTCLQVQLLPKRNEGSVPLLWIVPGRRRLQQPPERGSRKRVLSLRGKRQKQQPKRPSHLRRSSGRWFVEAASPMRMAKRTSILTNSPLLPRRNESG